MWWVGTGKDCCCQVLSSIIDPMGIYYQDESVTLHHGDSLEILPTLDIKADVLLTDPPYFKVKQEEWDNQWDKASEFLGWMGQFLDKAKPLLTPQASVWVFASPAMTTSIERLVGERFRVLNSIRWVKERGTHSRQELATKRSFLSAWEGVIFAEQFTDVYAEESRLLHKQVFGRLGERFRSARESRGLSRSEIEISLGYVRKDGSRGTAIYNRWEEGSALPGETAYAALCDIVGTEFLPGSYAELRGEYAALTETFEAEREGIESIRRPFHLRTREHSTDVWSFQSVRPFAGKHPCEKPQELLQHMIEASSRPGDTILDPFTGSGSTLIAASKAGRKAVGIEKDERWCEHAANRLSQGTLELEWIA